MYDLIVIGGGAAGLIAAGTAAERDLKVLLLEKMEKPGRKIRITGKGRCNLTNIKPIGEFLAMVQVNREFFAQSYREFDNRRLSKFMERNGVKLETERGGRVFPKSGKAWEIAAATTQWCEEVGVEIVCGCRVTEIMTIGEGDRKRIRGVIYTNNRGFQRRIEAKNVVLATGGASYPATGSTGDGYTLAATLGHSIEPIRPSLVPLESSYEDVHQLDGLLLRNITLKLLIDNELVAEEQGEMSFSERGVEGACVLRVSRAAVDALIDNRTVELVIDLKPPLDKAILIERIMREMAELPTEASIGDLFRKLMPRELVMPIAKIIGTHPKRPASDFTDVQRDALIDVLKNFRLPISDYRPWEEAIITAGGVRVAEINDHTMQSQLVQGLYIVGELLDLDANTGGYNLQIAFSTGRLAGRSVVVDG